MKIFTNPPNPIFFNIGSISIYWYGFLITTAIILGFLISLKLARKYEIKKDQILDLYFWLIIFGIIGARLYHVLCEWQRYLANPLEILKIWHGGLGIFGAIAAGLIVIWFHSKKNPSSILHPPCLPAGRASSPSHKQSFWLILDILSPALILGLAIGRWGNYFNQEIFGPACNYFWCIPIDLVHRPLNNALATHFHPTFLYESIASFIILAVLLILHKLRLKKEKNSAIINHKSEIKNGIIFLTLITTYTAFRFFNEFLRLDSQPEFLFLRLGQWVSAGLFIIGLTLLTRKLKISAKGGSASG